MTRFPLKHEVQLATLMRCCCYTSMVLKIAKTFTQKYNKQRSKRSCSWQDICLQCMWEEAHTITLDINLPSEEAKATFMSRLVSARKLLTLSGMCRLENYGSSLPRGSYFHPLLIPVTTKCYLHLRVWGLDTLPGSCARQNTFLQSSATLLVGFQTKQPPEWYKITRQSEI